MNSVNTVWGYARVSTDRQRVERQIDNIKQAYPDAVVIQEEYTGSTIDRPKWKTLEKRLKPGDTVVFDEVSRMSRNADEGTELYERLYDKGIRLVFLKEPRINSDVYREKMELQIAKVQTGNKATDKLMDAVTQALHDYMIDLAREQIRLAFETAQHELDFLHKRTSEGVRRAQAEGKQVGRAAGDIVETRKAKEAKPQILKHSKTFGGTLKDDELKKMLGISYGSLYKYKRELKAELEAEDGEAMESETT